MNKMTFLMPRSFRLVGILFFITGVLFGVMRFYFGLKPGILNLKVFAFYSAYVGTKLMEITRNNMAEEITGFFMVSGLFLFAFSRETIENEQNNALRLKAFFIAAYLNFLFLLMALFFTFGLAFVYMLMYNMGFGLLIYIIAFRTLLYLNRKPANS